ncbi:MAG: DNA polymerase III subunit alpha [Neisseriaceae bacterium]|nr:DNA polymerase III subunit alpha [Neisseriaceae bacterium]
MTSFVPLRLHSEYSLEDGMVRLPDAISFAKEQKFPALALTDGMNMFAAIKFYKKARAAGIVPILGADIIVAATDKIDTSHLLLLAKNHTGYLRLCELLSEAYLREDRDEIASITWDSLENIDRSGLICLSGAANGAVGKEIIVGNIDKASAIAMRLSNLFPNSFYLEIQRLPETNGDYPDFLKTHFKQMQHNAEVVLSGSLVLAEKLDLPVVATHAIQFLHADDFIAHEARVCIASGEILNDKKRIRHFHPSQYFLSADEMQQLFADLPEALENSIEIAKRCSTEITLGKHFLPLFPTPNNISLDDYLCRQARYGLQQRMLALYPNEQERLQRLPEYEQRLEFELSIIIQMGFPGYFLIVADFINWAKQNGCPVGPGRGSGAGSLVAYALKITDLDPLRYALLFERFLNPERVSMPDFDVDFCTQNRDHVIDYVRDKYGHDAVSQIITFGTLSSKAVVRDVGRVLELPFGLCDKLSKLIPLEANKPLSLKDAVKAEPLIEQTLKEEEAEELLVLAQKLEDLPRGTGMHAGGVLIALGKLTDFCPVYKATGDDAASVSMYDKDDVEAAGLVKFDFLGLRNLTIIQMAQDMIAALRGEQVDVAHIPLDDAQVYRDIFAAGNTTAVFQFESVGMKKMLRDARPTKFEEIIAFVALYRPGPMDLIPDFIRRMHGLEKFEYLHPFLSEVLEPTYGIMVYQEQVMQSAQVCAGYSLGGADMLRRAMGKKKPEEMAKQRETFVAGAAEKGIDQEKANEIFNYMEKFAGYGFNKSHAAAYALVAYQTAWLKKHYTAEFIAATMSNELTNTAQLKNLYDDAIANKITFLPPSINASDYLFTPISQHEIRYALGAIKGTGEAAIGHIVEERKANGAYQDLFDFCQRVNNQICNRRVLETLIRAGTFDELESNRAMLLGNLELAMEYAEQMRANEMQCGLFDTVDNAIEDVQMEFISAWNLSTKLAEEKTSLGFYFSAHPFSPYKKEISPIVRTSLADITPQDYLQWIGGFVTNIRFVTTKKGKKLCLAILEDDKSKLEINVSDTAISSLEEPFATDKLYLFKCKISKNTYNDEEMIRIFAEEIMPLDVARQKHAQHLCLELNAQHNIEQIAQTIKKYQQKSQVSIVIQYTNENFSGRLKADNSWQVAPVQALLDELQSQIGADNVWLSWKEIL